MDFTNYCRLCGKQEELLKDLNDESNKGILKIVKDLIQLVVCENDELPTKVCINCEEKLVSFQLFILECYKVQDTLQNMCIRNAEIIKQECLSRRVEDFEVKIEVKDESLVVNDSVPSQNEDLLLDAEYDADDAFNTDSESDTISLATLKETKQKPTQKENKNNAKNVMYKQRENNSLALNDYIKMSCEGCSKTFKNWHSFCYHVKNKHTHEPVAYCFCGYAVTSKTILYEHLAEHQIKINMHNEKRIEKTKSKIRTGDLIQFVCEYCDKKYNSWYSLERHCQYKHKNKPTVYCTCGVHITSKTTMYNHVESHRKPNCLRCDKCPKTAKTAEELEKHKMRHIPKRDRVFVCSSCDKKFMSRDLLKSHEKSHIPIEQRKIYNCEVCNLKFTTRSSLMSHKRIVHEKIKSYVCDLCGYACGTNGELRQHRAIHSDDKPFTCRKCSKAFKTYSNLKTHLDTHEDTSYVCYVCSRVLNSRRTLRKHLLVHDNSCMYVCNYCNKSFKRKQTLKVHVLMHTGDKPLSCKWCNERFAYASTLRSHRLRAHPDKCTTQYTNVTYQTDNMQQEYLKNEASHVNVLKGDMEMQS